MHAHALSNARYAYIVYEVGGRGAGGPRASTSVYVPRTIDKLRLPANAHARCLYCARLFTVCTCILNHRYLDSDASLGLLDCSYCLYFLHPMIYTCTTRSDQSDFSIYYNYDLNKNYRHGLNPLCHQYH